MQSNKKKEKGQEDVMEQNGELLTEDQKCLWERFPQIIKFKISKYNNFTLQISLLVLLRLAPILHALITYLLLSPSTLSSAVQSFVTLIAGNGQISIVLEVGMYGVKLAEGLAIVLALRKEEADNAILTGVGRRIMEVFPLLVEIDLSMSSFLLIGNFAQNLFGFLFTTLLYGFNICFLINYFDRKDVLYVTSMKHQLFLSFLTLVSFLSNSISVQFFKLSTFIAIDFCLSMGLTVWYFANGFLLFPNNTFRMFLEAIVVGKMTLSFTFMDLSWKGQNEIDGNALLIRLVLIGTVLGLSCRNWQSQLRMFEGALQIKRNGHVKRLDLFLTHFLQETLAIDHLFLVESLLDTKDRKNPATIVQDKKQTKKEKEVRNYVRGLYLSALQTQPKNVQILLDLCQFMLNESSNPFEVCWLIAKASRLTLGFFAQLRLCKLKIMLKESNSAFNHMIYEGRMQLENMLIAQNTFQRITRKIQATVNVQVELWETILSETINLTQVRESIEQKLALLQQTSQEWTLLRQYLRFQQRWKYIYLNYSFFLLNQRLSFKDAYQTKNVNEDNCFIGESTFLTPTDKPERLYSQSLLFDKKTFYLQARMNSGILQIITVSQSFQTFSEYSAGEMVGCPVHILMPEDLKQIHDEAVYKWLQDGSCVDETSYHATFTGFVTKRGEEVPAVKYYKTFVDLQSHALEFVCLIKVNNTEDLEADDEDEVTTDEVVNSEGIKKDFQRIKKSALRTQNNIFMKQENLQTNHRIPQIEQVKKAMRLLTLGILALLISLLFITRSDTDTITANITQFLNFLNLYRFPMALSKNYIKSFLNIGSQSLVTNQIALGTQNVISFNSDPLTLKTLFDQTLNVRANYPPFFNDSFNQGKTFDQVQIYSVIISSITSLAKLPINRTGFDFCMLNNYLIPSYDHMINATKVKFHHTFQNNLKRMFFDQVTVALTQVILFMVCVVFAGIRVRKYFMKGRGVLQIIFDFNDINLRRIQCYWKNIRRHFLKLHRRNRAFNQQTSMQIRGAKQFDFGLDTQIMRLKLQGQRGISFNRSEKHVFQTKKAKGRTACAITAIILGLLMVLLGVISIEIVNLVQITLLQEFQHDGYYFLKYYPATSVLGHALMERYYYQVYPNEVRYMSSRYEEYLSAMYLIGSQPYIGREDNPESSYYQKRKNYMFGNPCTFAPQVLTAASFNMNTCMLAYNKTLSQGITTLLRASYPQVEMYINQQINLTVAQLNDITTSLTLVAYFVTDAITTWASEFSAKVTKYCALASAYCIVAVVAVVILHLIFCQKFLFYFLQSDYDFIREVFDKMIPSFIISVEKVIRQRFVMEGIISQ